MSALLLPQSAEYALRAMAWIAAHPDTPRASDVAAATNIPLPYLQKVLRKLVVAGLLTGRKGHHGGFGLARPAAEIRFTDVLAAVDFALTDDRCAFGFDHCNAAFPCPLHPAYAALKARLGDWADTQTLANVDFSRLSARLAIEGR